MFYKQVEVMLMSLKAGNLGLNMVAASHVVSSGMFLLCI